MTHITKTVSRSRRLDRFFGVSVQLIGLLFLTRFIVDTGVRSVYPFIPQISTGLGLTVAGLGWLISLRALVGISGPIFGVLADRYGRRNVMAASLACQGIGLVGLTLSWRWWAILPMIPLGFGMAAFVPAGHAYISDHVPYQKRGRALATVEFSWALAGIVALPVVGWLIETFGWRSPFRILSLLSLVGAALIWMRLPPNLAKSPAQPDNPSLTWSEIGQLCLRPNILATIGVSIFLSIALSCLITVWGIWLSEDFGLSAVALGLVATAISLAELSGSGLSSLFIDRIGKRRGSQVGLLLGTIIFLSLPLAQTVFWLVIARLTLLGALLEFTIVSLIPLYSEQAPQARATVFSLAALGMSLGIALGAPITTTLWSWVGLGPICLIAALSIGIALSLVWRFLAERPAS